MIVVSNTSGIINLAAIDHLELLHILYGKIIIPDAVYHEIVVQGSGQSGAKEVQKSKWIDKRDLNNPALARALQIELDMGEATAIALAVELDADLLLIDERMGRTAASKFGLNFTGLLGVLVEAKSKRLIESVKPLLDDLKTKAGFWISQPLYNKILHAAGEK